jgi:penicillin-binding protein 1B
LKPVLDTRVAYVITNMMEGVVNFGLGYSVRRAGFTAPAAGKTGSSHDAWFAGYTSNLLCIVWVGFDDYTDLKLSGAVAAAPIWADFMKRAVTLPEYSDPKAFNPPQGVVTLKLDKVTNLVATPGCPDDYTAAFIEGTQPNETCDQANGQAGILQKIGHLFGAGDNNGAPKGVVPPPPPQQQQQNAQPTPNTAVAQPGQPAANPATTAQQQDDKKKKGFWGKLAGVFKDDTDKQQQQPQQPQPQPAKPH